MDSKYHILLLGGTGICGLIFTRAVLEAGHKLTLYVRTPSKIPADLTSNTNVSIIQGDLGDAEGLKTAAACGANIFISLAGPTLGKREGTVGFLELQDRSRKTNITQPITDALRTLYPLLLFNGTTKRILILSTASYSAPEDKHSIKWFFAINFYVKVIGGDTYEEIKGMAEETVALGEKIDWTVFRVPLLQGTELDANNGGEVNAVYVGDKKGRDGLHLDRGRLARWILKELEERKWVGACPILANV
jgi:nucleoside-diphosphate-sugar epimerase